MSRELDWFENRARITPHVEAIVDAENGKKWTYSELNQRSRAAAGWLKKQGINKGDRVALLSPNQINYFDLLFACQKIGAVFVPVNWRLAPQEIEYILQDCNPKLMGYHASFSETINELNHLRLNHFKIDDEIYLEHAPSYHVQEEITEKDPFVIIYTGGTTGKPKGVVLSHQSIFWNALNTILSWNLTNEDITLTYMPLFHTGGLNALSIPLLLIGGKVVLANDFKPEAAIRFLINYKCTIVLLVPTMYHMIVQTSEFKKQTFPNNLIFLSGGAPCPLDIYKEFQHKGLLFKEGYGLSEAGPNNFYMDIRKVEKKPGSVGKPMIFNTVKIMREDGSEASADEVGELLIKGKHLFKCYWNNTQATKEAVLSEWLYTGDLARQDDDGYFYIVGRKKDMIITGGENVYPLEVEQWISSHPEVNEAAVVGIPDAKWGEVVTAFIVLKEQGSLTLESVIQHCSIKLGKYKIPKKVFFIDELPKTHVGKIDKRELTEIGLRNLNS